MKIAISDIKTKMRSALVAKGYSDDADIEFIIEMYLGGELRGHATHGLASFPGFIHDDDSGLVEPKVVKETKSLFMIDAQSNPGVLVGKRAADEAIQRAQTEAVGTAIVTNMDSWLRPGAIAKYIADKGFFAIIMNDGGGSSIAPPGGYDPVLATNPIAYGIPTTGESLVIDMATSKRAWGQVRLANKYGTDLPDDTFYDNNGSVTRDPTRAHSVKPFGDYKGFALALMIEVLCGSLIGMDNMNVDTNSTGSSYGTKLQDRGGFMLVIDPRQTSTVDGFRHANTALLESIKASAALPDQAIRIPGEQAGKDATAKREAGFIDVPDELWAEISNF